MSRSPRLSNLLHLLMGAAAVAVVMIALVLAGVFRSDSDDTTPSVAATTPVAASPAPPSTSGTSGTPTDVAGIYAKAAPAVAFVEAKAASQQPASPFDDGSQGQGGEQTAATGSGFLIDGKGHIVTNEHVVDEG